MKHIGSLFLIITLSIFSFDELYAQGCYRTVSSFQMASGGNNINGTATLSQDENTQLILELSNDFNTAGGPDLHLFLSKTFAAPNNNNADKVEIAPLLSTSGAQTYSIPEGVQINEYDWLLIHCVAQNHFWGGGLLGSVIGNCISTGINDTHDDPEIFLTASNQTIHLHNTPTSIKYILAYDLLGNKFFEKEFSGETVMKDQFLKLNQSSGMLFIRIITSETDEVYRITIL